MDIPSRTDSGQTKFRGENILVTAICIFHITRLLWGNLDESEKQSVDGEDVGDDADDVDDNAVAHKEMDLAIKKNCNEEENKFRSRQSGGPIRSTY